MRGDFSPTSSLVVRCLHVVQRVNSPRHVHSRSLLGLHDEHLTRQLCRLAKKKKKIGVQAEGAGDARASAVFDCAALPCRRLFSFSLSLSLSCARARSSSIEVSIGIMSVCVESRSHDFLSLIHSLCTCSAVLSESGHAFLFFFLF